MFMANGLGKQAKTLTPNQLDALLDYVQTETRFPERNRAIVLLSFKAGLRAKEIAGLTWGMVTDTEGRLINSIALQNVASKGKRGGRVLPVHHLLKEALANLYVVEMKNGNGGPDDFVVTLAKGNMNVASRAASIAFLFNKAWFRALRFRGASSHSGRRTFITSAARKISEVGGSLRDVMALAGHSSIAITQRYVDADPEAQRKLIDRI
jgi:integrase